MLNLSTVYEVYCFCEWGSEGLSFKLNHERNCLFSKKLISKILKVLLHEVIAVMIRLYPLSKSMQQEVFWDRMLQVRDVYKWRIPRQIPKGTLFQYKSERTGPILTMYLCADHSTKYATSYFNPPHPPPPNPPIINVIFPLPTPIGLSAHGAVLIRRDVAITSVADLCYSYFLPRSEGDQVCDIQRDGP
jgi:hypothetical protein